MKLAPVLALLSSLIPHSPDEASILSVSSTILG
jgi:hypothetical protein